MDPGNGNFRNFFCIGIHFQIIRNLNIVPAIDPGRIYGEKEGIIFKWLTVLYVDPQNLMTNRRKPPPKGTGVGSEGKTIRATRFIYLNALHCKPVNA